MQMQWKEIEDLDSGRGISEDEYFESTGSGNRRI
jgi:hypothetical protein